MGLVVGLFILIHDLFWMTYRGRSGVRSGRSSDVFGRSARVVGWHELLCCPWCGF
jgi:hypothetical protein